jgi:hypothetical protein
MHLPDQCVHASLSPCERSTNRNLLYRLWSHAAIARRSRSAEEAPWKSGGGAGRPKCRSDVGRDREFKSDRSLFVRPLAALRRALSLRPPSCYRGAIATDVAPHMGNRGARAVRSASLQLRYRSGDLNDWCGFPALPILCPAGWRQRRAAACCCAVQKRPRPGVGRADLAVRTFVGMLVVGTSREDSEW